MAAEMQDIRILRDRFVDLTYRSFEAMRCNNEVEIRRYNDTHKYTKQAKGRHMRDTILIDLQSWFQLFHPLLNKAISPTESTIDLLHGPKISRACRVLHIHYLVLTMRLSNFGDDEARREKAFDTFGDVFEAIIQHAEEAFSNSSSSNQPPRHLLFSMEHGLIEPLYFTVLKCREPTKRAKALQLLDSCSQEAAWDGPLMTVIAREAVRVETSLHGRMSCDLTGNLELVTPGDDDFRTAAEFIWKFRGDEMAEICRVFAVALLEMDWERRTALVQIHYKGGTVSAVCAAEICPARQSARLDV
ncbi:hypothetical protein N0V83_007953 [Neocucurbitaria cava]|uniref:Uncharacterized protein n=1 Tax=Neocucurbitaria cava TaxID=798079 RepID=A0A9W9CK28_9PLEO|nr:hypothetical protein N0V83_007953 [Neocucurbitaria cava]